MQKEFDSYIDAEEFVRKLFAEDKWAIAAQPTGEGEKCSVHWIERKTYVSHTGETHSDEVWVTIDNKMILVQDLEAEHARNIVRMMLRQEREAKARLAVLADLVEAAMGDNLGLPDADEAAPEPASTETRTLH